MEYPRLGQYPASRETLAAFGGLDRRPSAPEGCFSQMENMGSRQYPMAASCPGPRLLRRGRVRGLTAKDKLCFVEDGRLFLGEDSYQLPLTDGEKRLVSMGAYILIFPDKVYFNTADPGDFGSFQRQVAESNYDIYPCDENGTLREIAHIGPDLITDARVGDYWYDTSTEPANLHRLGEDRRWQQDESFVRVSIRWQENEKAPYRGYFTDNFQSGDTVEMAVDLSPGTIRAGQEEITDPRILGAVEALGGMRGLKILDGTNVVFPGLLPVALYQVENPIRFGRGIPDMDFAFECGNRLWGCRWGQQNGTFVNEIYASALGDFRSFGRFQGLSTDSYIVSVGTDGPFTGAVNYMGTPLFFKENAAHRVYGSYPAEYRLQTVLCAGVAPGSGGSLALLEDRAFYLGRGGVYAYDGSQSTLISRELGELQGPGAGGAAGERYFLSLETGLYVYDSRRGLWHRQSPVQAADLCAWQGRLCYRDNGSILEAEAGAYGDFSMTTGLIAGSRQQRLRSVSLRLWLVGNADVWVSYDDGPFVHGGRISGRGLKWVNFPLRPRRCDHLRLKITGTGDFRLHCLNKTLEKGSDLP